MIKIMFMIHDLSHGGAEKVLVNLVNNMDPSKFDITVISLFAGGVNEKYLKSHIKYKTIFSKTFRGNSKVLQLLSPKQLHALFVKDKFDIEVSYLEGPTARIISGCQNKETKLVSWIHVQQENEKIASKAFRSYREAMKCYARFNHTICVSESVKKDFLNIFPKLNHVDVLYNTNETDLILKKKDEEVREIQYDKNKKYLCGVGKIEPIKGFDKLARIHHRLICEGYPIVTCILGVGSDKDKIKQYIKDKKHQDTFLFLGYQDNPYKFVANCDMFVCASTAEGFSTAATEALIVGTPVVTTPVAGMEEMLGKNNEYGIITGPTEKELYLGIKSLLDSEEKMDHYKEQALIRGKRFSKKETVSAAETFFLEILNCS